MASSKDCQLKEYHGVCNSQQLPPLLPPLGRKLPELPVLFEIQGSDKLRALITFPGFPLVIKKILMPERNAHIAVYSGRYPIVDFASCLPRAPIFNKGSSKRVQI